MERRGDWARNVRTGVPAGSATVEVRDFGTDALSTLYSDNGVTPKANPFTAAADTGIYGWYAANGRYTETITPESGGGDEYQNPDLLLYDPEDV
jgi:hypothetical protein